MYYNYKQEGHYTNECLSGNTKIKVALVQDLYKSGSEAEKELGNKEP